MILKFETCHLVNFSLSRSASFTCKQVSRVSQQVYVTNDTPAFYWRDIEILFISQCLTSAGTTLCHTKNQQDRQCTYNVTLRRVSELLLPWKSFKCYIFFCVCARARAHRHMGVSMRVRACRLAYKARNSYPPYCDVIFGPSSSIKFFDIIS